MLPGNIIIPPACFNHSNRRAGNVYSPISVTIPFFVAIVIEPETFEMRGGDPCTIVFRQECSIRIRKPASKSFFQLTNAVFEIAPNFDSEPRLAEILAQVDEPVASRWDLLAVPAGR
jgi:hypothetical protein